MIKVGLVRMITMMMMMITMMMWKMFKLENLVVSILLGFPVETEQRHRWIKWSWSTDKDNDNDQIMMIMRQLWMKTTFRHSATHFHTRHWGSKENHVKFRRQFWHFGGGSSKLHSTWVWGVVRISEQWCHSSRLQNCYSSPATQGQSQNYKCNEAQWTGMFEWSLKHGT